MHTGSRPLFGDLTMSTAEAASGTPARQHRQLTGSTTHSAHLWIARSPPSSLQLPSTCVLRLGTRLGTPILSGLLPCLRRAGRKAFSDPPGVPVQRCYDSSGSRGLPSTYLSSPVPVHTKMMPRLNYSRLDALGLNTKQTKSQGAREVRCGLRLQARCCVNEKAVSRLAHAPLDNVQHAH